MAWRRRRTLAVLAVGALTTLGAVVVDPAALGLLLDVDVVIAVGSAGLLMLGLDLRIAWRRVATSMPVVLVRAGAALTRQRPGSLMASSGRV